MAQQLTIPGGRDQGKTPAELDDRQLEYWAQNARQSDLAQACADELARRKGGAPAARAQRPAPQQQRQPGAIQRAPAPTELSLGKSMHDPAAVTKKLAELAAAYHIVTPATRVDALPPGCGVALSYVTVNADAKSSGPGEVYEVGGGKVALSGTTLSRIGAAAGVDWDPRQSGRLDNGADPHYCHFRAVGFVRNFDGSLRTLTGEVEIDARDGSPQIEEIETKARNAKPPRDPSKQILELRKFLLRHAERKAKNRAIADLGVKRSYNPGELQKPFAVARIMFTGETEDPALRQAFAMKTADAMIGGMAALYGNPPSLPPHRDPPGQPFLGHAPPPLGASSSEDDDYAGHEIEADAEECRTPEPPAPSGEADTRGEGADPNY